MTQKFPFLWDTDKVVVVVSVDLQKGFATVGPLANPRAVATISEWEELLTEAQVEGVEIRATQDTHGPGDPEFALFGEHCLVGTEGHQLLDEIAPFVAGKVHQKSRYSAFYGPTGFEEVLRAAGGPQKVRVVIFGLVTDICVHYTVMDLRSRGYEVIVLAWCCASYDLPPDIAGQIGAMPHNGEQAHLWALYQMQEIGGATILNKDGSPWRETPYTFGEDGDDGVDNIDQDDLADAG